jgi:molecular chaperone GrpE
MSDKKKKKKKETKQEDKNLSQRVTELEAQLKRALADYHNLVRRMEEKRSNWRNRAKARIVDKMLDVYDDLLRASEHVQDKGLDMAVNQFWAVLESEGVQRIKTEGREFDADLMDCAQVVKGPENEVMETIKNGYLLNQEVIRPAKVKVGQGKENKNE